MSTHSKIGYERLDGKIAAIYCHFDGYPRGVGWILLEQYTTYGEIENLVTKGAILSLAEDKSKQLFAPEDITDDAKVYDSREKYLEDGEEFTYLFTAKGWLFSDNACSKYAIFQKLTHEIISR